MFNFRGFLFSLLKGIYYTCAIHRQVNRQATVARILFAGFFGIFSSSKNKLLLDAQIKEYNTKISTRQNTYDEKHNNIEITPTAPHLPPLLQNHSLSVVPRNFRNLAITNNPNSRPNIPQSPIQHIMTHHSKNDNTYKKNYRTTPHHHFSVSKKSLFQPTMSRQLGSLHRSNSHPANLQTQIPIIPLFAFPPPDFPIIIIYHQARILILTQIFQFYTPSHNLITLM